MLQFCLLHVHVGNDTAAILPRFLIDQEKWMKPFEGAAILEQSTAWLTDSFLHGASSSL